MSKKLRGRRPEGRAIGDVVRGGKEDGWRQFNAEGAYAESIVRSAFGDMRGCLEALRQSLEILPTYAPAILSVGSVE